MPAQKICGGRILIAFVEQKRVHFHGVCWRIAYIEFRENASLKLPLLIKREFFRFICIGRKKKFFFDVEKLTASLYIPKISIKTIIAQWGN